MTKIWYYLLFFLKLIWNCMIFLQLASLKVARLKVTFTILRSSKKEASQKDLRNAFYSTKKALFFQFCVILFHSILKLKNEIIMTWFALRNWANVIFWITLKSFWIRTSIYFWKDISEQFSRQKGILLASCRSLLFF